jgi:Rps23 Pro-64 3,4-dihydroxylase Tpa1-like proline 4-hydroxylase
MGTMTGLDLTGHDLGLDLWEYEPGDWLSPHVDKPEKLVTQLLYLTEGWRPEHGGYLRVLRDAAPGSVDRLLAPALGSSTVLVQSGSSWHAVDSPRPGSPARRSLTITFSHGVG